MNYKIYNLLLLILLLIFFPLKLLFALEINDKGSINNVNIDTYFTPNNEIIKQLQHIILFAQKDKLAISLRGSGHSGGGHSFNSNGIVINLAHLKGIKFIENNIIRVESGAIWKEIIDFLNPYNLSVAIMQSDYDFTIGGTISTNVHGWQTAKPPIISSIIGFHILTANNELIYCDRTQNSDIFKAAIGGYGLLGIIIDVDLQVINNEIYKLKQWVIDYQQFPELFKNNIENNKNIAMLFGRFSLQKDSFLKQIILKTYNNTYKIGKTQTLKPFNKTIQKIVNFLFAYSYNNQFMIKLRWYIECNYFINKLVDKIKRNKLLYHSVNFYYTNKSNEVDILQEYFIPLNEFNKFIIFLQNLQNELSPALMNLTLRYVKEDKESILNYANNDMVCLVMYFRGEKTLLFNEYIKNLSIKLTDKALALKGKYYLPYGPFQTKEQFKKSYLNWQEFDKIKKKYDPNKLFINEFYKKYFN